MGSLTTTFAPKELRLKNIILCLSRGLLFLKWSYLQRCFDVAQRCENRS